MKHAFLVCFLSCAALGAPLAAQETETRTTVAELREALAKKRIESAVLQETASLRALLDDEDERKRVRGIWEKFPAKGEVALVPADQKGIRLVVKGTVVDPVSGTPVPGAVVYLYQTDALGEYTKEGEGGNRNPRYFGFVRADEKGRFTVRTIRPATYPGTRVPQHVHYRITAKGRARRTAEFLFDDDPVLTDEGRADAKRRGWPIVDVSKPDKGPGTCEVELPAGALTDDRADD